MIKLLCWPIIFRWYQNLWKIELNPKNFRNVIKIIILRKMQGMFTYLWIVEKKSREIDKPIAFDGRNVIANKT